MKKLLTTIFIAAACIAQAQNLRSFTSFSQNNAPDIYGVQGIYDSPGNSTTIYRSLWNNSPQPDLCFSFLKTDNYVPASRHFKIDAQDYFPISTYQTSEHLYVGGYVYQNQQPNYSILKLDMDGNLLAFKKINDLNPYKGNVSFHSLPNSNNLLLTLLTMDTDSTFQAHIYSFDEDLTPTAIHKKISFIEAFNTGYRNLSSDFASDFVVKESTLHYSILFNKQDSFRLEVGEINLTDYQIKADHNILPITASITNRVQFTQIAKVGADTVYLLVDNSLVKHPKNGNFSEHFLLNVPSSCEKIIETESGEWLGILRNLGSFEIESPIFKFKPIDQSSVNLYTSPYKSFDLVAHGDDIHVWGLKNSRASVVTDEFNLNDIGSCHPVLNNTTITKQVFPIKGSQVPISDYMISTTDMALPVEINLELDEETICNPSHLGISEEVIDLVSVYPNPTPDFIHIQIKNEPILSIALKTFAGSQVYQSNNKSNAQVIDISILPAGIYLVEITTESTTYIKKIIKQ